MGQQAKGDASHGAKPSISPRRERRAWFKAAIAIVATAAAASVTLTVARAHAGDEAPFQIGQDLHFVSGPGHSTGTFVLAGAASDRGTADSTATLTPISSSEGRLVGQEVLTGAQGTITLSFRGLVRNLGSSELYVQGDMTIKSGTSAYRGWEGDGDFYITVDGSATPPHLIRTDVGRIGSDD